MELLDFFEPEIKFHAISIAKCSVCDVEFTHDILTPPFQFQDQTDSSNNETSHFSSQLRCQEVLSVFSYYFKVLNDNENDRENHHNLNEEREFNLDSFPLCIDCQKEVARLSSCHDQLMTIQSEIRKIVAHISSTIMRTESEKSMLDSNFDSSSNSNNKYRSRILKSLNPKVFLVNSKITKPLSEKKSQPSLRKKPNCARKTIIKKVPEKIVNKVVVTKIEEEEEGEESQFDNVMETGSNHSNWGNDDDFLSNEHDDFDPEEEGQNLSDVSFSEEKITRNRKRKIQSKLQIKSRKNPKLSNSNESQVESKPVSNIKKFKKTRVKIREHITDLGDGKFLYFKEWGFHLMESGDKYKCDTCDYECGFRTQKGLHKAGIITLHIKKEHMIAETDYLKRIDETKFLYYDQYVFEKMELGYQCGLCLKIYPKVATVTHHIDKCHATGEFECEKCSRTFRNKGIWRSHSCRSEPANLRQVLEPSPGKFLYNGINGTAWNFELKDGKYHCSHCPNIRRNKHLMAGHIRTDHIRAAEIESQQPSKIKKFKKSRIKIGENVTDLGDGKFLYFKEWGFHLMESGDKYKCDTCDYECGFRTQKGLHKAGIMTLHIKKEHMIVETDYLKRIDETKFLYYEQYVFEKMELGYQCGQCLKIYPKLATVTHHIDKCHATGEFECDKCSRSFRNKGVLKSHSCKRAPGETRQILEVSPGKFIYNGANGTTWNFELNNGKYCCSHCPVVRNQMYMLGGHIRMVHDQPSNLVCEECGKSFNNKFTFEIHKNSHATDSSSSVQCAECGRIYKHLMGLRSHQQSAHNVPKKREREKTEACEICGQYFTSALTLRNHMQRIHEANVVCSFCGKKCQDKSALYQHERTHTLAKRYFCDMCDAGFPQNWQLVRHKNGATHRNKALPGTSDQHQHQDPADSSSMSMSMDVTLQEILS